MAAFFALAKAATASATTSSGFSMMVGPSPVTGPLVALKGPRAVKLGPQPFEHGAAFCCHLDKNAVVGLLGNLYQVVVKLLHRVGIGRDAVAVELVGPRGAGRSPVIAAGQAVALRRPG